MVPRRLSPWPLVATAAALLALSACGEEERPAAPTHGAAPPGAPATRGEREVISAAEEAETRENVLEPLDVPLGVGARAPSFPGFPEKAIAVIVFFRGEW